MRGLTPRQYQVLEYIRQSIQERGYAPTLREIAAQMGMSSTNGVNDHLRALETKGFLTRDGMKSRTLRPTNAPYSFPGGVVRSRTGRAKTGRGGPGSLHGKAGGHLTSLPTGDAAREPEPEVVEPPTDESVVTFSPDDLIEVRILGRVAAGLPILADENIIDSVRMDRGMLNLSATNAREVFGLRVSGDSMIEAGILNGDYLFVRRVASASRGEIVVALIGDEATVKYYFPEKDHIRFQPANAQMAPILVNANDFRDTMILGVVVGIYRRL